MISYCRPKIVSSNDKVVKILIPLTRRTKNHLNSMYFGALSIGADFTAGLLVLNIINKNNSKAKLIFKDFNADFVKRATKSVLFVCEDFDIIENNVLKNINNKKRTSFKVSVKAYVDNDLIAKFSLNTSIK